MHTREEFSAIQSSWDRDALEKPAGSPFPRGGKRWTGWAGQRERLALSDTAVVTFGVVLNSPWDSLYLKKRCDFLLVSHSRAVGAALRQAQLPATSYKGKRNLEHLFWWFFFLISKSFEAVSLSLESELGPQAMRGKVTGPKWERIAFCMKMWASSFQNKTNYKPFGILPQKQWFYSHCICPFC